MTTTREAAALKLDVTVETIDTIVGQFKDADLYDGERDLITDEGMELLSEQIGGGEDPNACLADLRDLTAKRTAVEAEWRATIRRAVALGSQKTAVADAAGVTRVRIYQILSENA